MSVSEKKYKKKKNNNEQHKIGTQYKIHSVPCNSTLYLQWLAVTSSNGTFFVFGRMIKLKYFPSAAEACAGVSVCE